MQRLLTLPPLTPDACAITRTPVWIGSGASADLRLHHPAVRPRHVGVIERDDGYWVVRGEGDARVDDVPVGTGRPLKSNSTIEIAPGCAVRFEMSTKAVPQAPSAPPRPAPAAPTRRRRTTGLKSAFRIPVKRTLIIALCVFLLIVGGVMLWRAISTPVGVSELSPDEIFVVDSLMAETYEYLERGYTLLAYRRFDAARAEFATGLGVLTTHPLHTHPDVALRILALEEAVGNFYREEQLRVPTGFSRQGATMSLPRAGLGASMSSDEFLRLVEEVRSEFSQRYRKTLDVTGKDHAEHRSLYGVGGARDLRTRTLSAEELQFVIASFRQRGIRVKDFSKDHVMQQQIKAAIAAGVPDRASTGLHLHIDRFGGRRDRWTVE